MPGLITGLFYTLICNISLCVDMLQIRLIWSVTDYSEGQAIGPLYTPHAELIK